MQACGLNEWKVNIVNPVEVAKLNFGPQKICDSPCGVWFLINLESVGYRDTT